MARARRVWGAVTVGVSLTLVLAACSPKEGSRGVSAGDSTSASVPSSEPPSPTTTPPNPPIKLSLNPAGGANGVSPVAPITVAVGGGTLQSVLLTNDEGKTVAGALAADKASWKAGEVLGYGKSYTLTAKAADAHGVQVTKTSTFSTVSPDNVTMPYINTAAGFSINPSQKYGVGQAILVHFDESITDKAAAEKALKVTTVPPQVGGWNWFSDTDVHWRPQTYFKAGTKVTVIAKVYGVEVGPGLYGESDASVSFRIGDSHISRVNDSNKIINVYDSGKLVRQMPTSMGKGGYVEGVNGTKISLWTNSGPHMVINKQQKIKMSSASFGLPATSPDGYSNIFVREGVRVSTDGEFVHWAPWSVDQQGKVDVSHGCLNVSPDNSLWFYNFSLPGDIVDVEGTPQKLQIWNSGDWTASWATWLAGSALH
ncbi:MAG: Ig-like domain-containing protein [Actinomycetota bacterium]